MDKVLPKGWVDFHISTLVTDKGLFSDGDWVESKDQDPDGEVRLIQLADIGINDFRNKSNRFIKDDRAKELKCTFINKNDVLIARMPDPIGRACIFPLSGKYVTVVDVAIVRFEQKYFNHKLFSYFVNSPEIGKQISNLASGSTRQRISRKNLDTILSPLPPFAEQERIVAKLDALFAQHEVLKKAVERIPQLLKNFRQQVLTQAVTGKLTKEFKYINIVKEIQTDRQLWFDTETIFSQKTKTKKPQKIIVKSTNDKSYLIDKLSKKIDITFFEEISAKFNNALKAGPFGSSLKKEYYVESGYKVYGQEQVINDNPFYGNYYINEEKYIELKSCSVKKNDILVSLVGTIGKVLIIPEKHEKGIINPRLVKLSLHDLVNPKYIKIYLQSEIAKGFFKENSHGGTMDVLNLSIIKSLPIPLPSTVEQLEIVSRVELLFTKADAIEARYKNLKAKIESLPQALLHKAFKGELVPQLPTDGDAKDLLAEILALKKDVKGKKKS